MVVTRRVTQRRDSSPENIAAAAAGGRWGAQDPYFPIHATGSHTRNNYSRTRPAFAYLHLETRRQEDLNAPFEAPQRPLEVLVVSLNATKPWVLRVRGHVAQDLHTKTKTHKKHRHVKSDDITSYRITNAVYSNKKHTCEGVSVDSHRGVGIEKLGIAVCKKYYIFVSQPYDSPNIVENIF